MPSSLRILYLAAGDDDRRGAAARDANLARGLAALGHDLHFAPLFAPPHLDVPLEPALLRAARSASGDAAAANDGESGAPPPFLMNAARLRLIAAGPLGRRLAGLGGRHLDHPEIRRRLAPWGRAARPAVRGRFLVHFLEGVHGPLAGEFFRALDHFTDPRPDVVVLSSAMLSAFAPLVAERWPGAPVAMLFADEDLALERLPEPWRGRARRLIRTHARACRRIWVSGRHQALRAIDLLALPMCRMRQVTVSLPGVDYAHTDGRRREPFTIGYLSAIAPEKGLWTLAYAFSMLARERSPDALLWIAGRTVDSAYWRRVERQLRRDGVGDRATVFGELDRDEKLAFFRGLSVFCVPARLPEARGLAVMEAMAAGVPVVAPAVGGYPELLRRTGGGTLLPPDAPAMLAETFALMMDDPDTADALGRAGQTSTLRHFSLESAAAEADRHLREMLSPP